MLLLALASSGFVLQTLSFALPALSRAWQMPAAAFSITFTLHLLGITLGALAFGRLGDMAGRKSLLLCAMALQAVATLACLACSSPLQLAALRLLAGAGIGGIGANAVALAVELAPRHGRTLWTTLVLGGVALGSSLPAVALQWVGAAADWRFLFTAGGLATLVLLPALALLLPVARAPATTVPHRLASRRRVPRAARAVAPDSHAAALGRLCRFDAGHAPHHQLAAGAAGVGRKCPGARRDADRLDTPGGRRRGAGLGAIVRAFGAAMARPVAADRAVEHGAAGRMGIGRRRT
ncbi:MAG: MFS transporter [Proteobacteria bacterium]|nr:MFS transporter [Pseudomonadota bacterium]